MKIKSLLESKLVIDKGASITADGIPGGSKTGEWDFTDSSGQWNYRVKDTFFNASKAAVAAYRRDKQTSHAHLKLASSKAAEPIDDEAAERAEKLALIMKDQAISAKRTWDNMQKSRLQGLKNAPIIAKKNKEWQDHLNSLPAMSKEELQRIKDEANASADYARSKGWTLD